MKRNSGLPKRPYKISDERRLEVYNYFDTNPQRREGIKALRRRLRLSPENIRLLKQQWQLEKAAEAAGTPLIRSPTEDIPTFARSRNETEASLIERRRLKMDDALFDVGFKELVDNKKEASARLFYERYGLLIKRTQQDITIKNADEIARQRIKLLNFLKEQGYLIERGVGKSEMLNRPSLLLEDVRQDTEPIGGGNTLGAVAPLGGTAEDIPEV